MRASLWLAPVVAALLAQAATGIGASNPSGPIRWVAASTAQGDPAPEVGVGGGTAPRPPATLAEAQAEHDRTARKCQQLTVEAVKKECLRQARETLRREQARLRAADPAASAARP